MRAVYRTETCSFSVIFSGRAGSITRYPNLKVAFTTRVANTFARRYSTVAVTNAEISSIRKGENDMLQPKFKPFLNVSNFRCD